MIVSVLAITLVIFQFGCSAQSINIGTFGTSSYFLIPESLRICSTSSCLYIFGQEQEYVAAKIQVLRASEIRKDVDDALAYNKALGYLEYLVLFSRDGTRFVLLSVSEFDVNGNFIGIEDKTEKRTQLENPVVITATDKKGNSSTTTITHVSTRDIKWSTVVPGSAGEAITRAVLSYADANFSQIDARSSRENFIKAK